MFSDLRRLVYPRSIEARKRRNKDKRNKKRREKRTKEKRPQEESSKAFEQGKRVVTS